MRLPWGSGTLIGLNFFGFIGLATIVVGAIRSTRQPGIWALSSIFLLLVLRIMPFAVWKEWTQRIPLLAFVTGVWGTPGVSYPLSPWLIYPLGGFILARTRGYWSSLSAAAPWLCLATVTLAMASLSALLAGLGAGFFRWGMMSPNYFIASIAVLGFSWALASSSLSVQQIATALVLRGPASLIVVPLHYSLIGLANSIIVRPIAEAWWWCLASALAVTVIVMSRGLAAAMVAMPVPARTLHIFLTITAVATLSSLLSEAPSILTLCFASVGQILVAWELTDTGSVGSK